MALTDNQILQGAAFGQYQRTNVTFPLSANVDLVIPHSLSVVNPESVEYIVLRRDRDGNIYNDQSVTRKAWGSGFIVLRSSVASLKASLLLTVPRIT